MSEITWLSRNLPDGVHGSMMDQAYITMLLQSELPEGAEHDPVFVVPGRFCYEHDDVAWLIEQLPDDLCLLIVTSDEEGLFPYEYVAAERPHATLWVMTPKISKLASPDVRDPDLVLGHMYGWHTLTLLREAGYTLDRKSLWYSGQINHHRRDAMVQALQEIPEAEWTGTPGFLQGVPADEYYRELSRAKVTPSPSGPFTADSFRTYEALAAGTLPIVDDWSPKSEGDEIGWWERAYPGNALWPIRYWDTLPSMTLQAEDRWPADATRASAWWSQHQAELRHKLHAHTNSSMPSDVTIIVTTSPIDLHPDTSQLEEVVSSTMRQYPNSELIIVADGVRPEQEYLREQHEEYLHHVAWLCNVEWSRAQLIVHDFWRHQAGCVRTALERVRTPLLLMLEHDTPLTGFVYVDVCRHLILDGEANVIRFYHDTAIPQEHMYLMEGMAAPLDLYMMRTRQWSQRPHLASTEYYRKILDQYFGTESRTFIEDVMYGVVVNQTIQEPAAWDDHCLWIYAEDNGGMSGIKRSAHLDGRGAAEKAPCLFAYDGDTPPGAPAPTEEGS